MNIYTPKTHKHIESESADLVVILGKIEEAISEIRDGKHIGSGDTISTLAEILVAETYDYETKKSAYELSLITEQQQHLFELA